MASTDETSTKRCTGQVKWFNNKAGYGFITMKGDDGEQLDIFAHYSTVHIEQSQYKYLVQGEYVEFELSTATNTEHKYQATSVTGIDGGKLMCETRQANRQVLGNRRKDAQPKTSSAEEEGFTQVKKRRVSRKKTNMSKEPSADI